MISICVPLLEGKVIAQDKGLKLLFVFQKASLASECASVSTAISDDSTSTSTSSAPGEDSDDEDEELDKALDESPRRKFSTSTPEAPVLPDILFTWKEVRALSLCVKCITCASL